jgi:hypothetical protein
MARILAVVLVALVAIGVLGEVADARPRIAQVQAAAATDAALAKVRAGEQQRTALFATRATLSRRYEGELREIDKLKRQRASWRRDRQLRTRMASSLETAKQLTATTGQLATLDGRLLRDRRALVAAIDGELKAAVAPARRASLQAARRVAIAALPARRPHKIVLPDDSLDLLADPEELDQQAAALRDSEAELARQLDSLDRQAERFRRMAELRRQHARADDLAERDDDQPRRQSGRVASRETAADTGNPNPAPPAEVPPSDDEVPEGAGGGGAPDPSDSFDGEPAVVLAEVVDASTVDALRQAERSSDPAAKAAAARRAREQVAARLAGLKARRAQIEQRARELRH